MEEKQKLRSEIARLRIAWEKSGLAESDRKMEENVLTLAEWKTARVVFCYVSVRDEPSTRGLLSAALESGKRLCVPRCEGRGIMHARQISSLGDLKPAPRGLLEPGADAPIVPPSAIELAVVPCVAADRRGYRIGHGGGYYDRYLANLNCLSVCLCRERALFLTVPIEGHDLPVGMVLTESELIRIC
jgi:5-formyltetrahydrofolate cyclo-ligase